MRDRTSRLVFAHPPEGALLVFARPPKGALRLPRLLSTAAVALLPACGFVGFEGQPSEDSGMPSGGADAASSMDSSSPDGCGAHPGYGCNLRGGHGTFTGRRRESRCLRRSDPPATQVVDYCQSLPRLQRNPVIDGVVDSALNVVALTPVAWTGQGAQPDHTTASFALAWRPNGLYVFMHVVDPNRLPPKDGRNIWEGDGAELYFDTDGLFPSAPTYENPGMIQIIVAAPADDDTPSTKSQRFRNAAAQGEWMSTRFAAFPTADGYILEGLLQADTVDVASLAMHAGEVVGIDLGVNVSVLDDHVGDAGVTLDDRRLGQYFLHVTAPITGCGGQPYCTPTALCTPTLVD